MAARETSVRWLWTVLAHLWVRMRLGPDEDEGPKRRRQKRRRVF